MNDGTRTISAPAPGDANEPVKNRTAVARAPLCGGLEARHGRA